MDLVPSFNSASLWISGLLANKTSHGFRQWELLASIIWSPKNAFLLPRKNTFFQVGLGKDHHVWALEVPGRAECTWIVRTAKQRRGLFLWSIPLDMLQREFITRQHINPCSWRTGHPSPPPVHWISRIRVDCILFPTLRHSPPPNTTAIWLTVFPLRKAWVDWLGQPSGMDETQKVVGLTTGAKAWAAAGPLLTLLAGLSERKGVGEAPGPHTITLFSSACWRQRCWDFHFHIWMEIS